MLFGNQEDIAIEFLLDEEYTGTLLYGKVCYWICGHRVGDYEHGTYLLDVLYCWERISFDASHRSNDDLMRLNTKQLAHNLYCGLFGDGCDQYDEFFQKGIEQQWARHDILPHIDVFGDWFVFLVEDSERGRCVYYNHVNGKVYECNMQPGDFDKVLTLALGSLASHYNVVSQKYKEGKPDVK